jgi:hypothetical protein
VSTAIAIGTRVYLIVDASERGVMQAAADRSVAANPLYGIGDCDEEIDDLRQLAQMFADVLEEGALGSSPRIGTRALDSSYAGGAYLNEQGAEMYRRFSDAYAAHLEGPCRPLNATYALPAAQAAAAQAESAVAALRIVRDDPEIAQATVEDDGKVTATTTDGEVLSIGNTAGVADAGDGGRTILIGLALATTVLGAVWLLFKGKR